VNIDSSRAVGYPVAVYGIADRHLVIFGYGVEVKTLPVYDILPHDPSCAAYGSGKAGSVSRMVELCVLHRIIHLVA
jgi:hypothetical protein